MKLHLVIVHMDMVVDSLELEPGSYSIGRSKENNIVVQHFSLDRTHGQIVFDDGQWTFTKTGSKTPQALAPNKVISLSSQISIATQEYVESESARLTNFNELQENRGQLLRQRKWVVAAAVLTFVFLPILIFSVYNMSKRKSDPNQLLSAVRSRIVELEGHMDPAAIEDYKKLAGMKDSDFRESIGFCTGFLVDVNVVLTASHCLFGSMVIDINNDFYLKTHDGKKHKILRVLGFDIKRDYLFLETENMESYGFLKFAEQNEVGQKVFTIGNVHGEGIAIRDGILASETADLNDPEVQFIRYSAGTSPGNSGGPLIDSQGDIVALVFASTWTENYNLGTPAKDLKKGFEQFVADRNPKNVKIQMKKLLSFNPPTFLQTLSIPYLTQFDEYPEVSKNFREIEIEIEAPIDLATIDRQVLGKLNKKAVDNFQKSQELLIKKKEITLNWKAFLSSKTPAILPSQFDFSQNEFVKVNDRYFPKTSGFIDSPSKADMTKYREQLKTEGKFDFQSYGYNISYSDKAIGVPEGNVFYVPKDLTGRKKRLFDISQGIPYSQLVIDPKVDQVGAKGLLAPQVFLDNVLGEHGVLFNTASRYSRPKSARDFIINKLNPKFSEELVKDKSNRLWRRYHFQLFGSTNTFIYCHDLPDGTVCMSRIFRMLNPHLLKIVEMNFRKFVLSHLIINPYFWPKEKLFQYVRSDSAQGMKSLDGISLKKQSNDMWVQLKNFAFMFKIPNIEKIESIRLQTGLFMSDTSKMWSGYGIEWIERNVKGDKVCGIGLEPFQARSTFILNYLRDRRKQEKMKKMKGDDADPLPGVWYKLFRGVKNPFQAYGYCAPLVEDPRQDNSYFVDFKKSKILKYQYKFL